MNAVETQEAGTGKWFPIIIYTPGTDSQQKDAERAAQNLQVCGFPARITGFNGAA